MWFSFSTNILISVTAILLYVKYRNRSVSAYYWAFVLLTGFSSFVAAFGHLPLIAESTGVKLLYVSRLLNFVSITAFIAGTLEAFNYFQQAIYKGMNMAILLAFVLWLSIYNNFTPVIIYSIIGIFFVGGASYIINYKTEKEASMRVLSGIVALAVSAIVFSLFKSKDNTIAADIGHFLISAALILLTAGFNKIKRNEVTK